jgi:transcriptional regulator with XRE-family HTH domain
MAVRQDFAAFLRHAMNSAGYVSAAELSRASGVGEPVLNKWLSNRTQPTIELLRKVAPAIGVPLLELLVAAGRMTAIEAGLEADPTPPAPAPTIEEQMLALPMSDDKKQALIALLHVLRDENDDHRSDRRRREA